MFALMQSTRAHALHLWSDPSTGLRAVVAIHSEQLGPAFGGCRYLPYADDESAISDALHLARNMSYKAALAGLPLGGAKAVILRSPHVENRAALFEAFGRFVDTLQGRLVVAVDSGTSTVDMDCIARSTVHVSSTTAGGDPAPYAAMGVFAGLRATAQARLGSSNLEGLRVALQGLGNVGFALAEQLHAAGAELLVSDLDPGRVRLAVERFNAWPVAHDAVLSTPCDIFTPCGVGPVLSAHSVMQLRCAAVAGAANQQLTGLPVADQLESRGILYAPDTVINSGGLIYVALSHHGQAVEAITEHLARIPSRLTEVFAHAQAENRSPARVAQVLAERLLYG
ncbi:Leu/Phe/Val dehydrogenase [Pseudomonas cremoricolorata]|uniref:Amino acid dehydrogenase n=1 Tax=Pseudomonas cremoricolorata TaxID=157783 RepID=A0A089WSQ4_9PSED|nr:Glu/Leu/Phe/Val dehydrogenase dimerization domain-containing protein [Pseudomonas cremoricolorata]AIR89552.1 amino acid dehydrogenase [Pseudomonas cremoricolorata]